MAEWHNRPMKKVEHITLEASKLFARYGFEGVTMRDVADACGITMATLYYHFNSKGELHDEITQCRFEEFIGAIRSRQEALPAQEDTPSALLGLIVDAVLEDPTLFNLMQRDLHYFDEDSRHYRSRKKYSAFLTLISDTVRRHWQRPPDVTSVFSLAALITGYCELVQADERSSGPERDDFVQRHRSAMIALVKQGFDDKVV